MSNSSLCIDFSLVLLVTTSALFDVRTKRIPNNLTLTAIIFGIFLNVIFRKFEGFVFSGLGFLLGLGILLFPFILGGMGGGDVKLMAAIGALKGWRFVLLTTVYSGLVGGIIIIIILIKQKRLLVTLKRALAIILKPIMFVLTLTFENKKLKQFNDWLLNSQINWEKQYIPYGVAIGIGAIMALLI